MLILGKRYRFTDLEKKRLAKHFLEFKYIDYLTENPKQCVEEIKSLFSDKLYKIVILNISGNVPDEIVQFLTRKRVSNEIEVITIEHFLEKYLHKCYIPEDQSDLHYLEDLCTYTFFQKSQKIICDYVMCVAIFVFALPSYFICRYKTKSESPGPVFFLQKRVGLNNEEFLCVKYRSMCVDAETNGPMFCKNGDTRIFNWGKVMRKTRLDELPQILNVLKGDMHFIGPRPERKHWIEDFEEKIPFYTERHIIKPGITGWAQVMYTYGDGQNDARQKLMYDLYYIKYWNILLDLRIIYKTIFVVLKGDGL